MLSPKIHQIDRVFYYNTTTGAKCHWQQKNLVDAFDANRCTRLHRG